MIDYENDAVNNYVFNVISDTGKVCYEFWV